MPREPPERPLRPVRARRELQQPRGQQVPARSWRPVPAPEPRVRPWPEQPERPEPLLQARVRSPRQVLARVPPVQVPPERRAWRQASRGRPWPPGRHRRSAAPPGTSRESCGRRGARWSTTPTSRTLPGSSGARAEPCSRLRAPLRARRPGPWPHFSCLGPDLTGGRTVVSAGACSSLRTHRRLIAFDPPWFVGVGSHDGSDRRAYGDETRCYVCWTPRCRATAVTSVAACSRRARPNALRRTASSKHSGRGCSHAPRPGIRCRGSGRRLTGEPSPAPSSVAATTRSSADQLSDPRHPTQVRDGSARSPVRSATRKSSAYAAGFGPRAP